MYSEAKRQEAIFFLNRLRQHQHHDDEFSYFLSAFVASFRSVTFAMQYEYSSKNARAASIYDELQASLKADEFALAMREARNDQQKQGHTWPRLLLALTNEETGAVVQFEGAPLPKGFERFRGVSTITPLEKCLPLTGDVDEDGRIALQQSFMAVLSLREGAWRRDVLVRIHKDCDPMSLIVFFQRASSWLERFKDAIAVMERNIPVQALHHVLNETEAMLAESFKTTGSGSLTIQGDTLEREKVSGTITMEEGLGTIPRGC